MAARMRQRHQDDIRAKIQADHLIVRLADHALGKLKKPMDRSQVAAALGLLKKTLPDLAAIEHSGEDGGPLRIEVVRFGTGPAPE